MDESTKPEVGDAATPSNAEDKTKPEVGDATTPSNEKDKDSHEQPDTAQAPKDPLKKLVDEFNKTIAIHMPYILAAISRDPGMVSRVKEYLAVVREDIPWITTSKPELPFLSQFFNFTEIEVMEADCSSDDLAEYVSFVQTAGEIGGRTTLTDYLIARNSQPLAQQQLQMDYTIAQMVWLRANLKKTRRLIGHIAYIPVFYIAQKRAKEIEAGELNMNSMLDGISAHIEHCSDSLHVQPSAIVVKSAFTDALKSALTQIRGGFYDITKAKQDYLYNLEDESKWMSDEMKIFLKELTANKYHTEARAEVAAQMEVMEEIDRIFYLLP
ncbi:hypothetical protein VE03_07867 [Pseudogymnoascus sp. 23342-1-I1]|nr:hypothetical protein VE03_07867 [Pseudogymnoascus sp. 23342-1-I1]